MQNVVILSCKWFVNILLTVKATVLTLLYMAYKITMSFKLMYKTQNVFLISEIKNCQLR